MSFKPAVSARLLGAAPVAARVGTRVDWEVRQQGAPLDAITIEGVLDPRPQHFKGFQSTRGTHIQVNCWGATEKRASELAELVIEALTPPANVAGVQFQRAQGISVMPRPERTETEQVYREIVDLTLWHDA